MNLNHFLKSDREKAQQLYGSLQFLIYELLVPALEKGDFDRCIDDAENIVRHCRDLKKMQHPEKVVQLNEIASEFFKKGIDVECVKPPTKRVH